MNALSTAMGARLAAVCAELAADRGVRAWFWPRPAARSASAPT